MLECKYFWDDNGNLCRFKIEEDGYGNDYGASDPREWDNVGKMRCWYKGEIFGDNVNDGYTDEDNFLPEMYLNYVDGNADTEKLTEKEIFDALDRSEIFMIPLFIRPIGGDNYSICEAGYKHNGHAWGEKATILREYGDYGVTEENWREKANKVLMSEVIEYNMYLRNEVYWYGVDVARKGTWDDTGETFYGDWDQIDTCGGFYSEKWGDSLVRELATEAGLNPDGFYDSEEAALAAHAMPLEVREIA